MSKGKREHRIPIVELFGPTIQGEGLMQGTFSHFLRTAGCPLKCKWCDTPDAVLPERFPESTIWKSTSDILAEILELPYAPWLTLTGGDPCIHPDLGDIIPTVNAMNMHVAVETQGSTKVLALCPWLIRCDVITFSPKGPSSGNIVDIDELCKWIGEHFHYHSKPWRLCIKVVIFTLEDMDYAFELYTKLTPIRGAPRYDAFYFMAGTEQLTFNGSYTGSIRALNTLSGYTALANYLMSERPDVHFNEKTFVGCQQHVLLWPNETKGV